MELAEPDILKKMPSQQKEDKDSPESPDGEKTVPVVIRWPEPAKSGNL